LKIKNPLLQIQASLILQTSKGASSLRSLIPQSSALKIKNPLLQIQASLILQTGLLFIRDRGGVRTPNPQSRNLIFYPIELRSRF
jgi:hypothetical protein